MLNAKYEAELSTQNDHLPIERSAYLALVKSVVESTVTRVFGVEEDGLALATRGPSEVAFARQVAMYLVHVAGGLTLTDVGQAFGRDRTTVAYACLIIEDWRDDTRLDRSLELIEAILRRVVPPAAREVEERRRPYQRRSVA